MVRRGSPVPSDFNFGNLRPKGGRVAHVRLRVSGEGVGEITAGSTASTRQRGISMLSGSGDAQTNTTEWWVWPLPAHGDLTFTVGCVELGLAGAGSVSAQSLIELARLARPL
jgi:hypothetical protein